MVRPLANRVIVTADKYNDDGTYAGSSLIDASKKAGTTYKEFQKVVAVGPVARNIEVNDIVKINPSRYAERPFEVNSLANDDPSIQKMKRVTRYHIPSVIINDVEYLMLTDQDFDYVVPDGGLAEVEKSNIEVISPLVL